jgi:hypothetical protein
MHTVGDVCSKVCYRPYLCTVFGVRIAICKVASAVEI